LEELQMQLAEEGLSSLGRLEGQVLITIERVLRHFKLQSSLETLYSEVADDVEKYRNLYRLNTMREND
jgi:hypothetical protein